MSFLSLRLPGHRTVASAVLVFFVAGMAACLVCDVNGCCEEAGHQDDLDCACGCVIHSTLGMSSPSVSVYSDGTFELEIAAPQIRSTHPPSLFRPPRS